MKDRLNKIWNSPVWSAVIVSAIFSLLGALISLFKGWLCGTETIPEAFKAVFGYKVNVWIALAVVIVLWMVIKAIKKKRSKKKEPPITPFVNDFTEGMYQGLKWRWRWQWSKSYGFYYLTDLNLVCPQCNDGLLTVDYMNYQCGKCGADISWINADHNAVKTQILADARKKYSTCKEYIGEIKSGYMKE